MNIWHFTVAASHGKLRTKIVGPPPELWQVFTEGWAFLQKIKTQTKESWRESAREFAQREIERKKLAPLLAHNKRVLRREARALLYNKFREALVSPRLFLDFLDYSFSETVDTFRVSARSYFGAFYALDGHGSGLYILALFLARMRNLAIYLIQPKSLNNIVTIKNVSRSTVMSMRLIQGPL